jgi:hypothetical protein
LHPVVEFAPSLESGVEVRGTAVDNLLSELGREPGGTLWRQVMADLLEDYKVVEMVVGWVD